MWSSFFYSHFTEYSDETTPLEKYSCVIVRRIPTHAAVHNTKVTPTPFISTAKSLRLISCFSRCWFSCSLILLQLHLCCSLPGCVSVETVWSDRRHSGASRFGLFWGADLSRSRVSGRWPGGHKPKRGGRDSGCDLAVYLLLSSETVSTFAFSTEKLERSSICCCF